MDTAFSAAFQRLPGKYGDTAEINLESFELGDLQQDIDILLPMPLFPAKWCCPECGSALKQNSRHTHAWSLSFTQNAQVLNVTSWYILILTLDTQKRFHIHKKMFTLQGKYATKSLAQAVTASVTVGHMPMATFSAWWNRYNVAFLRQPQESCITALQCHEGWWLYVLHNAISLTPSTNIFTVLFSSLESNNGAGDLLEESDGEDKRKVEEKRGRRSQ
ncbi:hypothetical protein M422DRAFT_52009 [Sphaerobolus stellatus SS14]|uniref:Uncharacterized protein n=1 Tax=Sphaerobolus stellatus (strain SS14) TaxID=990650 RepID=A0A0C9VB24_SPHS4|nr:hypothetical protein M422DRAFT_52009 [Sphaerobolus stellatus SS14]